jgi:hypothetical protein
MSTAKTIGEWLDTLCKEDVEACLKQGGHSLLQRLSKWSTSIAESADSEKPVKMYRLMYRKYLPDIESLLSHKLLVPVEKSLQVVMEAKKPSVDNCRITTLCIPTCGRTDYLSRCVSSFSQNLRTHGRQDATVLVIDDSADRTSEARNREMVISLAPNGPQIQFAGYEERQALIRALLRKKVAPPEVIQFALNAERLLTTEGAVRNTMMLMTCGQYILQTDDDTSCAYVSANTNANSVTISAASDPYQTYFYTDRQCNLAAFPINTNIDAFAIHEAVLGKSLSDVLKDRQTVTWDKMNPHVFTNIGGENGRIDITTTGASGDPGMGSNFGLLTFTPVDTLRRIYSSPESYRIATKVREVLRLVPELTISRRSTFQAMSFGINNTRLQPPFFPLGRNLDGAFALLYNLLDSQSLIGHTPFAISHQSEPDRRYGRAPADAVCGLTLTDILQLCLLSISNIADASLNQNLRCMGEQLVILSSIPRQPFRSFLRKMYAQTRFELLSSLERISCEIHVGRKEWNSDIDSMSNSIRSSTLNEQNILPRDLIPALGMEEALDKAQSFVLMYGKLMLHWESITASARDLCPLLEV